MTNIIQTFPNAGGGGKSGHTIQNESGTAMTARANLKIVDANVSDDSANNATVIDVSNKVDKVQGKGLSTEDYTTEEKTKLSGLSNYDDTALSGRVSNIENVVPSTATSLNKLATMSDVAGIATDYDTLDNKPQIAGTTLTGNKTLSDLGIQPSEQGKGLSTNDYSDTEKEKVTNANNHLSTVVTDTNGVHGFKADVSTSRHDILYKSGNQWKSLNLKYLPQLTEMPEAIVGNVGKVIQYIGTTTSVAPIYKHGYVYECIATTVDNNTTYSWKNIELFDVQKVQQEVLPAPSAEEFGNIYQYTGTSTPEYVNGYYYECILDGSTYVWTEKRVQSAVGQVIQYDSMPIAKGSNVNRIIQYTGESTNDYTNGFFYKCVAHEEESGGETVTTYAWEQKNVQLGGDARIKSEILEFGVDTDDYGFRPYIMVDLAQVIPDFSVCTLDMIALIIGLYYDGEISLADVKNSWSAGDTKQIYIPATDKTAAQNVDLMIAGFDHDVLTESDGDFTKAFITLSFMMDENLGIGGNPYTSSSFRTWLDETFIDAIPTTLKDLIRPVNKQVDNGFSGNYGSALTATVSSKVFVPSCPEFIGRNITQGEAGVGGRWSGANGGGSQYEAYANAGVRSKNVITTSVYGWWTDSPTYGRGQAIATPSNTAVGTGVGSASGFMPHFCV